MRETTVVASLQDMAGMNIAEALIRSFELEDTGEVFDGRHVYSKGRVKLVFTKADIIHADHLDSYFSPDSYVFVSRHRSEKGIPCLTAHFPGNFSGDTSYGGQPKEVGCTYPTLMKKYVCELWSCKSQAEGFQVVVETTHHGPTSLNRPVLFVEIGSSENEWCDKEAADLVAKALWRSLEKTDSSRKIGIGFGGPHYSEKFTEMLVDSDFALGAIAAKYALPFVNKETVQQMVNRCVEPVRYAALDWKGLGAEKARLVSLLGDSGLEVIRI